LCLGAARRRACERGGGEVAEGESWWQSEGEVGRAERRRGKGMGKRRAEEKEQSIVREVVMEGP